MAPQPRVVWKLNCTCVGKVRSIEFLGVKIGEICKLNCTCVGKVRLVELLGVKIGKSEISRVPS